MIGVQERKWKHARPIENWAQNGHIITSMSFYWTNQVLQPATPEIEWEGTTRTKSHGCEWVVGVRDLDQFCSLP